MNINAGGQCARRGSLSQVVTDWMRQLRSRRELEMLDDAILRDIGLTRRGAARQGIDTILMN